MDRVYLLIEGTDTPIPCLLNPETVVQRRQAGVQPRRSVTGRLTGASLADDPLLCTGGGRTELELDLLFDVTLGGSSIRRHDVRDLTKPLWDLAENVKEGQHQGRPPLVQFQWGKTWDFRGVVVAVAERLDLFTAEGVPQRSWLRLRLLRSLAPDSPPVLMRRAVSRPALTALTAGDSPALEAGIRYVPLVGGVGGMGGIAPGLEIEPSVLESLRIASDMVLSAIASTPAGEWVASARQRLGETIVAIGERIREWWETPSPLGEAIKAGVRKLGKGMAALVSTAKERIVSTATIVAAHVSSAFRAMKTALTKLASPVERAIARVLTPLLDNLRPVVWALRQAAAVVATAVRAQAKRLIAAAVIHAESGLKSIGSALQSVGSMISAAGERALETLRSGAEKIAHALEALRQGGDWLIMENIAPVLGAMGAAADLVWAAGKRSASRAISRSLTGLGVVCKNLLEAKDAVRLVSGQAVKEVLIPAVAGLRAALEKVQTGDAAAPRLVDAAWADLEAGTEVLPAPAAPKARESISRACATIREALPALADADAKAVAVERISAALEQVSAAADPLAKAEEAEAVHLVQTAAVSDPEAAEAPEEAEAVHLVPTAAVPGPEAAEAPDEDMAPVRPGARPLHRLRLAQRERLDQVAFRYYADPAYWRVLALFNNVDDPLHIRGGTVLRVPPAALVSEGA